MIGWGIISLVLVLRHSFEKRSNGNNKVVQYNELNKPGGLKPFLIDCQKQFAFALVSRDNIV